jgi:hypothetical protein
VDLPVLHGNDQRGVRRGKHLAELLKSLDLIADVPQGHLPRRFLLLHVASAPLRGRRMWGGAVAGFSLRPDVPQEMAGVQR